MAITPKPAKGVSGTYQGDPGTNSRYYWIQAIYPSSRAVLSSPVLVPNIASLNPYNNKVSISWRQVPGAIGYDVIVTTTSTEPMVNSTATIGLIFGTTSNTFTDQGQVLQSWTYETGTGVVAVGAAGPDGAIQYNAGSSVFGGSADFTRDLVTGLVTIGNESALDPIIQGYVDPQQFAIFRAGMDSTSTNSGIGLAVQALPTLGIVGQYNISLVTGALVNNVNSAFVGEATAKDATGGHLHGVYGAFSTYGASTIIDFAASLYGATPFLYDGSQITTGVGVWVQDMSIAGIVNPYYSWFDSRGVRRVKEDSTFDSVGQAIEALYNPQFTKYTPGAVDYERIVLGQWNGNVAEIGTEKGGTGTLRSTRIIGTDLKFGDLSGGTFEVGDATKAAGIHVQGAGAFSTDSFNDKVLLWLDADDQGSYGMAFTNRAYDAGLPTFLILDNGGNFYIAPEDDGVGIEFGYYKTPNQWQAKGTSFQAEGWISTLRNTAPADVDIAANELADWFDPANGVTFAMFKGKSADGTVVTGGVSLNTVSAPTPGTIVLPTSVYGGSAQLLGGPTAWGSLKVAGTTYKIPLYTT